MGIKSELLGDVDEYLDLVDNNDYVIGQIPRSEIYDKHLSNFRIINGFIVNKKGQIWIPRRSKNKRLFPLFLDASIAGHVKSGESYDDAFKRELKEELNIDIKDVEFKILRKTTPQKDHTFCFSTVYEIEYNQTPNYNKEDFVESYWLTPNEILDKIEKGDKAKSDLPILINLFYIRTD